MSLKAWLIAYEVVKRVLFVALLITGVFVGLRLALIEQRIEGEIPQLRPAATAEIGRQGDRTRELVDKVAADLAKRSERQIKALRADLRAESAAYRKTFDGRLAAIQADAAGQLAGFRQVAAEQLGQANASIGQLAALRADLKPSLDKTAAIAGQVNEVLPLFLDCEYNQDCIFNRYVGASKGFERAMLNFGQASQDARLALPHMLTTWDQIGVDVSGTAANLNRLTKPRWYDRLLGYGLNGVVIYRNLNPATSLTVKGAQFVASRP
jgi:hypothetical protein